MARADQEDEFFEKDPDEVIPAGFHIVGEDEDEDAEVTDGALADVLASETGVVDDPLLGEEEPIAEGKFGGNEFDFEHNEEES